LKKQKASKGDRETSGGEKNRPELYLEKAECESANRNARRDLCTKCEVLEQESVVGP